MKNDARRAPLGEEPEWIRAGRRPFREYAVGSLVPVVYERYARIFHPAWSTTNAPLRWEEVAAWSGRTMHALAQWESLSRPLTASDGPAPFSEEPWADGLPPAHFSALRTLLASHTSTPDRCFVGVWEGYGWLDWADPSGGSALALEERTFIVRGGPIETTDDVGWRHPSGPFQWEPPTIVWPTDRAWFVASDPDLDSTYLGGPAELIGAILASDALEAWPVEATDRITDDSDLINEPRNDDARSV